MLSTILVYVSLFLQVAAAVIAISLFKRTKFNASWILISVGFLLMVVSRVFDLWPTIYPEMEDELAIVQKILAFIIALVLLIGVFYIRKIFQFMRRVDEIRRESEKRVLAAVIRTEEQERQRFAKELHDGLGPLLSVIKMLVSGLDANKESEVNEKIKQNLRQAVDEAISGVRDISANISPHILNNFGLKDAVEAFIKRMRQADNFKVYFTTNLENQRQLQYRSGGLPCYLRVDQQHIAACCSLESDDRFTTRRRNIIFRIYRQRYRIRCKPYFRTYRYGIG